MGIIGIREAVHGEFEGPVEFSIAVPVFNEVENLEKLVDRISEVMKTISHAWELILVDDGSTDGSFECITRLRETRPFLRGLKFNRNHGQTAAMDAGIKASRGDIIITMDADLQNDPSDIPVLLEALNGFDAAVGWRHKRQDSIVKRISSQFANWVRNFVSHENIRDTGCSLKAFRAEAIKKVKLFEGMHRFLPTLIKLEGGKVAEVKVRHFPRVHGKSKYNIWNRVFRSFLDLLAIRWMKWRELKYHITNEV